MVHRLQWRDVGGDQLHDSAAHVGSGAVRALAEERHEQPDVPISPCAQQYVGTSQSCMVKRE